MIELHNISKVFEDAKKRKVNALSHINLSFKNKGFYTIIGKSGSGKSTLLNILSGLVKPSEGDYIIRGISTNAFTEADWASLRRNTLAYVFQEHNLIETLTVIENLSIVLFYKNLSFIDMEQQIQQILTQFELEPIKNQLCKNLSGGEKQRVAIIRALLSDSPVVIADEPTSALDETNTKMVYDLLKEISKSRLVIVVTHDMDMTQRYSDVIIKLNYGHVVSNENLTTESTTEITPTHTAQLPFRHQNQLASYFSRGQWVMKCFTILFLLIGLTLMTTTFAITQFNEDQFDYGVIKDNVELNYVSAFETSRYIDEKTSTLDFTSLMPELITYKTYFDTKTFNLGMFNDSLLKTNLFSTIVITPLENNHIIITDYHADIFKQNGILNFNTYADVVGMSVMVQNLSLIIDDVVETGYSTKLNISSSKLALLYDVLSVNEATLNRMLYLSYPKNMVDNDVHIQVLHPYSLERMLPGAFLGSNQLVNQEIVVDYVTLNRWLGGILSSPEDAQVYFNQNFDLSFTISDNIITSSYTLKGVIFTDLPTLYFSEELFQQYFEAESNLFDRFSTLAFRIDNYQTLKLIKTHLATQDLFLIHALSSEANFSKSFILSISQIFVVLALFSFGMVTLFIYFFTYLYFKQNRFTFGILLSLGYKRQDTLVISSIHLIQNIVISFLISTVFSTLVIMAFNKGTQKDLGIEFNMISMNLYPYMVTILFTFLIASIGILTVYRFIRKVDIIQLLKTS